MFDLFILNNLILRSIPVSFRFRVTNNAHVVGFDNKYSIQTSLIFLVSWMISLDLLGSQQYIDCHRRICARVCKPWFILFRKTLIWPLQVLCSPHVDLCVKSIQMSLPCKLTLINAVSRNAFLSGGMVCRSYRELSFNWSENTSSSGVPFRLQIMFLFMWGIFRQYSIFFNF